MRKIPPEFENPIDNFMVVIADQLNPFFKRTGHTPNLLTTYSLVFGLVSIYFAYQNHIGIFLILFTVSYFFDCADGNFARAYKMTSRFGDIYDHTKDLVVLASLSFVICYKYGKCITRYNVLFIFVMMLLAGSFMGCQQRFYKQEETELLDHYKALCPNREWISFLRYFGPGTFVFVLAFLLVYLHYFSTCK